MAGFIAFSGLLSLFPFLIFAATLTGILVGSDRSDSIIEALFDIAPEHVALTLAPVVEEVLSKQSGEVLTLSAVFAIWVASSAVEAFRIAFDRAYAVPDPRSFIHNRALAILLVFIGAVVAALLGVTILFMPLILRFLEQVLKVPVPVFATVRHLRFGVMVFVGFLADHAPDAAGAADQGIAALAGGHGHHVALGRLRLRLLDLPELHAELHGDLRHAGRGDHHADVLLSHRRDDYIRRRGECRAEPDGAGRAPLRECMAVGLRKRRRIQLVVVGAVLLAAATALVGYAMRDGIEFFRSPSQLADAAAARRRALPPRRARRRGLGGAGRRRGALRGDRRRRQPARRLPRHPARPLPRGPGRDRHRQIEDGTFVASEILAKHDERYMPKEVADALKEQGMFHPEGPGS